MHGAEAQRATSAKAPQASRSSPLAVARHARVVSRHAAAGNGALATRTCTPVIASESRVSLVLRAEIATRSPRCS